jgi:transcriptional regulator
MTEEETPPLYQRNLIEWRKSQVLKLWSKGWSQQRIANELKCSASLISRDLIDIHKQAAANIENHLHETIPRQWTQCLEGLKNIMAEGWNIYDSISNDPTIRVTDKTSVLALIKDCYKHMLDLNADSTIVSECINFSKRANNKLQLYQPQRQLPPQQAEEQPLQQEEQGEAEEEEVEQQ